jgi:hypothetical protein
MTDPVQFMSHHTAVEYAVPEPSDLGVHFAAELGRGRIIGHTCSECGKVYVPPRGYCPLCVVETTDANEVLIADRGTVTTFSVITPLQYQGQQETEDYVQATLLLDGSDTTIMVTGLEGIAIADVRTGLRVEAVWAPKGERDTVAAGGRGMGLGDAVQGWRPTGEPDLPREQLAGHVL